MKLPEIVFQNEDLIAIDKPTGLLSIPDRFDQNKPSAYKLLQKKFSDLFVVHRLDRNTSGVLLFALNAETHRYLSLLFQERKISKRYQAFLRGELSEENGLIDQPIIQAEQGKMKVNPKGKPSKTIFHLLENFDVGYSWVEFEPLSGRTHQIRVHAAYMGHPIVGDEVYGDGKPVYLSTLKRSYHLSTNEEKELPLFHRLALHASSVHFTDKEGQLVDIQVELPKDMKALKNQLTKLKSKNN